MKTQTRFAIAALALALTAPAFAADAKENWDKDCAKCHGADGKGQTRMGRQAGAKDYTDAKVQEAMDDTKAAARIKDGFKDGAKEVMKPYGDKFNEADIKALVAHMRSFKK